MSKEKKLSGKYFQKPEVDICYVLAQNAIGLGTITIVIATKIYPCVWTIELK